MCDTTYIIEMAEIYLLPISQSIRISESKVEIHLKCLGYREFSHRQR